MGGGGEDPGSGACREGGGQQWSAVFRILVLGGGVMGDAWHRARKVTELAVCIELLRSYIKYREEFCHRPISSSLSLSIFAH